MGRKYQVTSGIDENPSTRTSKDNKTSPMPVLPKALHGTQKEGSSADKGQEYDDYAYDYDQGMNVHRSGEKSLKGKAASHSQLKQQVDSGDPQSGAGDYMNAFKSMIDASPPKNGAANSSSGMNSNRDSVQSLSPKFLNAADSILSKRPTAESERENAERVDALLMELFPERFQKQQEQAAVGKKGGKAKGSKKAAALVAATAAAAAGAGFNKNQVQYVQYVICTLFYRVLAVIITMTRAVCSRSRLRCTAWRPRAPPSTHIFTPPPPLTMTPLRSPCR